VYAARRLVRSDVIKADREEEKEGKSKRIERERERGRGTPAVSSLAFTTGETIVQRDNQVLNSWRQPAACRISGVVELVC